MSRLSRESLGERLCQWHSSMGDPIYAVGSFYVGGHVYPKKEVVDDCLSNLRRDIDEREKMLRGEIVQVERLGRPVNLKVWAGYKNADLRRDLKDLREIAENLEAFVSEDY